MKTLCIKLMVVSPFPSPKALFPSMISLSSATKSHAQAHYSVSTIQVPVPKREEEEKCGIPA